MPDDILDDDQFEPEPEMDVEEAPEPRAVGAERTAIAVRLLQNAKESVQHAIDLLEVGNEEAARQALVEMLAARRGDEGELERLQAERVVEGVFDGEQMIGSDGHSYAVPANYASKSRLVEGDILKLTVRKDGTFLYKQIGPMERRRIIGRLAWDASANGYVAVDDAGEHVWKLLTASVSFYKGQEGDRVVLLLPRNAPSVWAAVENIVRE